MPRKSDLVHNFFETSENNKVKLCKYCQKPYAIKTNTNNLQVHVKNCKQIPNEVKSGFITKQRVKKEKSFSGKHRKVLISTPSHSMVSFPQFTSPFVYPTPSTSSSSAGVILPVDGENIVKPTNNEVQCNEDALNLLKQKQAEFKEDIAKMIFGIGIPIRILDHALFKELFNKYIPSLPLPNSRAVSTTYIDNEHKSVSEDVTKKIHNAHTVAIQWDSYTNIRKEPIINIVVTTPQPILFKTIHPGVQPQTGKYMAEQISHCIEELGEMRVVGGVIDNCSAMKAAKTLLNQKYNHLVFYGCSVNILNLLMQDLCKESFLENVIDNINSLIKEVDESSLKAWFSQIQKEKGVDVSLKRASKTKFAGHCITLNSAIKNKMVFKQMSIDCHPGKRKISLKKETKLLVLSDEFWKNCETAFDLLSVIMTWTKILESDTPQISMVVVAFNEVFVSLCKFIQDLHVDEEEGHRLIEAFNDKKDMAVTTLHLSAHLLDIVRKGCNLSAEQQLDAMAFIENLAKRDPSFEADDIKTIQHHLSDYMTESGLWERPYIKSLMRSGDSHVLWKTLSPMSPLARIASRILYLPATSATGRSFSAHAHIQSKRRNRLANDRAAKLIYLKYNYKYLDVHIKEPGHEGTLNVAKKNISRRLNAEVDNAGEPRDMSDSESSYSDVELYELEDSDKNEDCMPSENSDIENDSAGMSEVSNIHQYDEIVIVPDLSSLAQFAAADTLITSIAAEPGSH